ncbi:MAG: DUF2520 domain-containing protein [Prevotella sp.]|nr:DUF2520 domain-containing protein [Prevotella sp.]MDY6270965.1 DUF2520 domain-containing protein [Prevotella sp.]
MKIVMIGAGNVATHLATSLMNAGHDIVQIYSRTWASASALATLAGGAATDKLDDVVTTADVYIFSLTDSVLGEIIPRITKGRERKVMVHTAGSMPLSIFEGMALHYGVLYPMQTFSKQRKVNLRETPFFIEANDDYTRNCLMQLAGDLSDNVRYATSEQRKYLHLSAVWACNFTNHCYAIAAEILQKHDIPFSVMLPLIDETARKVHELSPKEAQTGPAVRFDENVIRAQAQLLKSDPLVKDLYERMSLSISRLAKK